MEGCLSELSGLRVKSCFPRARHAPVYHPSSSDSSSDTLDAIQPYWIAFAQGRATLPVSRVYPDLTGDLAF